MAGLRLHMLLLFLTLQACALPLKTTSTVPKGLKPSSATPVQVEQAYAPIRRALIVGVNKSPNPSLPVLKYAESDARAMSKVLAAPNMGGFEKVTELVAASRAQVLAALLEAEQTLRPDDTFLFYFSGHGSTAIDDKLRSSLFLVASDTSLHRLEASGISVREIQERLSRMPARRKVLIIDACYNGVGKSGLSSEAQQRRAVAKGDGSSDLMAPPRESEAHLFATAVGQSAMEDNDMRGGVYTHYLLEALSRGMVADTNQDGAVSVAEAHTYSRDRTMERTGYRQVPWASYRIVGREDVFLSGQKRAQAEKALVYTFDERFAGARVVVDATPRGTLPGLVELEPGVHRLSLQAPDGTSVFDEKIALTETESLALEDLEAYCTSSRRRFKTATYSAIGATAGLGLASMVTGLQTLSMQTLYMTSTFETEQDAMEVKARGEAYRRMTNLLLSGAAVSAVSAGLLHLKTPSFDLSRLQIARDARPHLQVTFTGLALHGRF